MPTVEQTIQRATEEQEDALRKARWRIKDLRSVLDIALEEGVLEKDLSTKQVREMLNSMTKGIINRLESAAENQRLLDTLDRLSK